MTNLNFPSPTEQSSVMPPKYWRLDRDLVTMLKYRPRQIHQIMGEVSHHILAHISEIREQEKFRADLRFPLFQIMQRRKRYAAIFKGPPYLPIFA